MNELRLDEIFGSPIPTILTQAESVMAKLLRTMSQNPNLLGFDYLVERSLHNLFGHYFSTV